MLFLSRQTTVWKGHTITSACKYEGLSQWLTSHNIFFTILTIFIRNLQVWLNTLLSESNVMEPQCFWFLECSDSITGVVMCCLRNRRIKLSLFNCFWWNWHLQTYWCIFVCIYVLLCTIPAAYRNTSGLTWFGQMWVSSRDTQGPDVCLWHVVPAEPYVETVSYTLTTRHPHYHLTLSQPWSFLDSFQWVILKRLWLNFQIIVFVNIHWTDDVKEMSIAGVRAYLFLHVGCAANHW